MRTRRTLKDVQTTKTWQNLASEKKSYVEL